MMPDLRSIPRFLTSKVHNTISLFICTVRSRSIFGAPDVFSFDDLKFPYILFPPLYTQGLSPICLQFRKQKSLGICSAGITREGKPLRECVRATHVLLVGGLILVLPGVIRSFWQP